jgi:Fe-S-cluster-containing dehydrogenase component
MKAFRMDPNECSGCYSCQITCKDEHCGNDWSPYAKPQPEWGQFWGKINEYERGNVPQVKVSYVFVPCQHCVDAPCIKNCSYDAIYTRDDGLVIIDPKKCTGCQVCISSCPYKCIYYNAQFQLAQKCTGCAHLIDRKAVFAPRCADACAHMALQFGEESELDLAGTETLNPEYGLTTRVHYINLPKQFVAGTVYDPSVNEVVVGAACTLTAADGSKYTATTDDFGDFWIEELPEAEFTLTISNGTKNFSQAISTVDKSVGLGDVALS